MKIESSQLDMDAWSAYREKAERDELISPYGHMGWMR